MLTPPIPANEDERLSGLQSLNILDTAFEERFDRITRLAKHLFGVPIVLISLIDENRQWFKSCEGLQVRETPRDISFCAHAINDVDVMMISDATQDKRFHDNPLVTGEPNIRFYAGCPIRVNNHVVGTFCLIDRKPQFLDHTALDMLRDLAAMVERELALVQLATTDDLTQISSRRGFTILAQFSYNQCVRLAVPCALLFFDLDSFKNINDSFGHAEGDEALKNFASTLRTTFRQSDVVARVGGDEFIVFASNIDKGTSQIALKRLNNNLAKLNSHRKYKIGYSVGVIERQENHKSLDGMMKEADKLMYNIKDQKNAVNIAISV